MVDIYRPIQKFEGALRLNNEPLLPRPDKIIYAGQSNRRENFLRDIFPSTQIDSISIDPEPQSSDTSLVMHHKINKAYDNVSLGENDIIIAADTRTSTPILNPNGRIDLLSRGKPSSLQEVFNTFQLMNKVTRETGEQPWYEVNSSSGIFHQKGLFEIQDVTHVRLKREGVELLSRERGFLEYVERFEDFYSKPPYHNSLRTNPEDLSAGISLPVLNKMGIVESVNNIGSENPLFYKTLRLAIHIVAIGLSIELLELIGVDRRDTLPRLNWINQVTKRAIGLELND
jgi:predicted house-cleaning NTP pyrophosphatase (Maf/HAM1 superfamily)